MTFFKTRRHLSSENTGSRNSEYCGRLVVEGKDLLVIRVRLNNNDQLWHLYQALRGHCEVEMVPDSEGPVLEIPSDYRPRAARQCSAGSTAG